MREELNKIIGQLKKAGWSVELQPRTSTLPAELKVRYPWIPADYLEFVASLKTLASSDDKAWFLTAADFTGSTDSAYAWNEWERQSLDAAGHDDKWKSTITAFWDKHLPILLSLKSGYSYFAIRNGTLDVVCGEEPEFEETTPVANSLVEFLTLVAEQDPRIARWV